MKIITYAPHAWEQLQGIFCIYKPPEISLQNAMAKIKRKLSNELNELESRPLNKLHYCREYINLKDDKRKLVIEEKLDLSDHVLSVGPRYDPNEICMDFYPSHFSDFISGVTLLGLNTFKKYFRQFYYSHPKETYIITGKFGRSTVDHTSTGKTTAIMEFRHVTQSKLERKLAIIKSMHARELLKIANINDSKSQITYELASRGLLEDAIFTNTPPLLTDIKLLEYRKPYFKLEISGLSIFPRYLLRFTNDIGISLNTVCHSTQIRRTQLGPFGIDHALSHPEWTVENIIDNINATRPILNLTYEKYKARRELVRQLRIEEMQKHHTAILAPPPKFYALPDGETLPDEQEFINFPTYLNPPKLLIPNTYT